jgi:transposase
MMGVQSDPQNNLFHYGINLNERIRANHPLRKVNELIDFEFVYDEVKDCYGIKGNESVPPPVILKLMLLLIFYNVRSERELMETIPERMDWLWFLGYDLDTKVPNHSVLSKARKKWGAEVFQNFFERIVLQCVQAGLVDGSKIFVDSSLIDANASNNSVLDTKNLQDQLHRNYRKLETRLAEGNPSSCASRHIEKKNSRYISTTDPDAAIVNRGKPKLMYQVHRTVDGKNEVITATAATAGDVNEAHLMLPLLEQHEATTGSKAETVVADSKYGTIDNFLACHDQGVKAHIPDLKGAAFKRTKKRAIFTDDQFVYDPETDTYHCPAGKVLKRKSLHMNRESTDYGAPKKVCAVCELRSQCTKNKTGRTVKRHLRQDELNAMREQSRSAEARQDIKTRQHLMERSFAQSTRYDFDRARWRGLWRMRIQELLVCTIQNIQVLIKQTNKPKKAVAARVTTLGATLARLLLPLNALIRPFCFEHTHSWCDNFQRA